MTRQRAVAVFGVAGLLVLVGWWWRAESPTSAQGVAEEGPASPATPTAASPTPVPAPEADPVVAAPPGPRWVVDQQHVYRVAYEQNVAFRRGEQAAGNIGVAIEGEWSLTVAAVESRQVRLLARLEPRRYETRAGDQRVAGGLEGQLDRPHEIVLGVEGEVVEVRFPPEVGGEARRVLRALAQAFQRREPGEPSGPEGFEVSEVDAMGSYVARYEPAEVARVGDRGLVRSKLEWKADPDQTPPHRWRHETRFDLAPNGWPRRARLTQEVKHEGTEGFPEVGSKETGAWDLTSVQIVAGAGRALDGLRLTTGDEADRAATRTKHERMQREWDEARVKDVTLPGLLASLRRIGGAADAWRERHEVMRRLRLLVDRDEAAAAGVLDRIRGGAEEWELEILLGALTSAQAPGAYDALVEALDWAATQRPEWVRSIAASHALATGASPDGLRRLEAVAQKRTEAWQTAMLAAGATARKLGATDAEATRAFVSRVVEQVASEEDWKNLPPLVSTLGNAGHADGLAALEAALGHDEWRVRASAVYALRAIDSDKVDPLLVHHVRKDVAIRVREQALRAIDERGPTPFATVLAEVLTRDESADVRGAVIDLLERHESLVPTLHSALSTAATGDADEGIRERAARLLNRAG